MKIPVPVKLEILSRNLSDKLFIVGGYVRNYLAEGFISDDIDLAGNITAEEFSRVAEENGFNAVATYPRTGTVKITDGEISCEFTRFRKDGYSAGGRHSPDSVVFTDDIKTDALRRDFKCNAVYYDVDGGKIVDPLNGVSDIENRLLDTVKNAELVLCSDGLRLLRLARFVAETGFSPTDNAVTGARKYAENIKDIASERITEEIKKILVADKKYPFSPKNGHYVGFSVMEKTGVLGILFPEITENLSFSLKTLSVAESDIRLAAFLLGASGSCRVEKAENALSRFKFDKKTVKETLFLVNNYGFDLNCEEKEEDVRLFIAKNVKMLDKLLRLNQAGYLAETDRAADCPAVMRWKAIFKKMKDGGAPFSLRDLPVTASNLKEMGFADREIGNALEKIFVLCVKNPEIKVEEIKKILLEEPK